MIGFPKVRFKFFIIISIIFISGCQENGNASSPPLSNKTSPGPASTEAPSQTPTPAPGFTPTITLTPTITPSPTNTITPSWTPVPTLPLEEALDAVDQIHQDNGGCELPCVWGVSPGETPWEEVRDRFSPLGTIVVGEYWPGVITYTFRSAVPPNVNPHEYGYYSITFHKNKGGDTIETIMIGSRNISPTFDPRLSSVLDTFGKPEQIWMDIVTGMAQNDTVRDANYRLILFYPSQGYIILYQDDMLVDGKTLRLCPWINVFRDQPNPTLFIYSEKIEKDFKDLHFIQRIKKYSRLEDFQDKLDAQTFYETFLDPYPGVCIDVDLDMALRLELP